MSTACLHASTGYDGFHCTQLESHKIPCDALLAARHMNNNNLDLTAVYRMSDTSPFIINAENVIQLTGSRSLPPAIETDLGCSSKDGNLSM